jgi:putative transposase
VYYKIHEGQSQSAKAITQRVSPRLWRGDSQSLTFAGVSCRASCREPLKADHRRLYMNDTDSLSHTKWECKYHVVWIPKYRKKKLFEELRKELGPVLRELARHKESEILEGKILLDHVHMLIASNRSVG